MKPNVLVAYNDPVFGRDVESSFRLMKCRVDRVQKGMDAVSLLSKYKYDIIFTSLTLDEHIDGESLFHIARKKKEQSPLTIGITSHIPENCANNSFDLIFVEPLQLDAILMVIRGKIREITSRHKKKILY